MKYDFHENPRAWQFTGEIKPVSVPNPGFFGGTKIAYQWVFEKILDSETDFGEGHVELIRIGVMIVDGRISIQDPPAGE